MLVVVGAAVALPLSLATAEAAPTARLRITGEACSTELVVEHTTKLLGRDPFAASAADEIAIGVARGDGGMTAELTVRGRTRMLTSGTCDDLAEQIAVVVALALREEPSVERVVARERAPSGSHRSLELRGGTQVGGSSHGLHARVTFGAALRVASWSLGLEVAGLLPEERSLGTVGTVRVAQLTGALVPCWRRGSFAACGVLTAGALRGASHDVLDARAAWSPHVALGVRVEVERAVSTRMFLQVLAELDAAVTTSEFAVDGMAVWTTPRLAGWAGLGVGAHFP